MHWTVHLEGGPQRVNHAAVAVGNKIYSFGGYSSDEGEEVSGNIDIYVLDTDTLRWNAVIYKHKKNEAPFKRYGHTVVAHRRKIYLWGGRNDLSASNILHCFDIATSTWSIPATSGEPPLAADGHSACVIDDYMYLFGGFEDATERFSQSVYRLNLLTFKWQDIEPCGIPPDRRDFHTASAIGHRMYIFGGRSAVDGIMDDEMKPEFYNNQIMYLNTNTMKWIRPDCLGWPPCGRRSHCAVVYEDQLYVIGGYDGISQVHLNDIYKFNPVKNEWTKMHCLGQSPCPRRRHCACVVDKQLFLFGGSSPRAESDIVPRDSEQFQKLVDHSDLHVLDFDPSLKRLCQLVIIKYGLKNDQLPKCLIQELHYMTTHNIITKNDFFPRKDYGIFSFSA